MESRRTAVALSVGALAAAAVLFAILSGGDDDSGSSSGNEAFSFELRDGEAVGGVRDVSVTRGDEVTVTLATDADARLHVVGYELEKDVDAGDPASITFTADAEGQYEVEAHRLVGGEEQGDVELADLSVEP